MKSGFVKQTARTHLAHRLREARKSGLKGFAAHEEAFKSTAFNLGRSGISTILASVGANTRLRQLKIANTGYGRSAKQMGKQAAARYAAARRKR